VLGLLCVRAHQVVARGKLIDAAWNGEPPPTAVTQLQGLVSALRRAFGDENRDLIATTADGYVLRGGTDLGTFRELAERARADQDQDRFRDALDLWRARPLDGLDCAELEAAADQVEQEYVGVLEEYAALELRIGHRDTVIEAVTPWAMRHPLRERLQALLIQALASSGRQAEAHTAYHALRQRLADELGVGPGPELRDLYQRLLAGDRGATSAIQVRPAQVPAAAADFTGRTLEVADLCETLLTGCSAVVISAVTGTGGIGKSALAAHVAHLVAAEFPGGQLYVNLAGASPDPAVPAEVLARLLRDLGVPAAEIPAPGAEREARYRSVLAGRKVLLVLDDAKDAAQVRPLLPGTEDCAVLITSRASLADLAGVSRCDLSELNRDDALALFARIAGPARVAAEPAATDQVLGSCGGLPLAIRIAGAKLAARPGWTVADMAARLAAGHDRLRVLRYGDLAVRASFQLSYDGLPVPVAGVFRLLGLTPPGVVPLGAIAALTNLSGDDAEQALDVLADAHLIENPAPGRYRLHDLLRLFAAELAGTEPAGTERRMFSWYGAALRSATVILAQARRMPPGVDGWPAEPAGEVPAFATHSDALGWVQREEAALVWIIKEAVARGWHELATRMASLFTMYFLRAGSSDAFAASHQIGAESAAELGDDLAQAWLLAGLGLYWKRIGENASAVECYQRSLILREQAGDRNGVAACHCNLGNAYVNWGRHQEGLDSLRRAAALSEELGDDLTLGMALSNIGVAFGMMGEAEQKLAVLDRAVEVLGGTGDRYSEAVARVGRGEALYQLGRLEEALAQFRSAEVILKELGMAQLDLVEVLCGLGETLAALGRPEEARQSWQEAAALAATGVHLPDAIRARIVAGR
jgi:DNA-binding SARP family transcriptional activator/tetratricopeptide (TPR) repeat protein